MKAAFVVFDRMTYLDFIGFYDPVTRLKSMKILDDFEWRIFSPTSRVVDDRGLRMEPDTLMEPLASYDMLFVPGGMGTRPLQHHAGRGTAAAQRRPASQDRRDPAWCGRRSRPRPGRSASEFAGLRRVGR